jgi:nicotinate-nucleotide adenylyltransferase
MNIGYFGGTFDPIHNGHLALADAALEACHLDRVLFVPTDAPPHKRRKPITSFIHRYTMVSLALNEARERNFVPSLLEQPGPNVHFRYSIDTVRALRRRLRKSDRLFFLIGIDAFLEIATWHQPEALLHACDFIVVSRPGYSLAQVADALPPSLRPRTRFKTYGRRQPGSPHGASFAPGGVVSATIHLVEGVKVPVSATHLRAALRARSSRARQNWRKMLPASVAAYIQKMHLYEKE